MFEKILKRIENSPVYATENGYKYFLYPYKGIEPIYPAEIKYLAKAIAKKIDKSIDLLFTFETDGICLASAVSLITGKPLVIARKFHYNVENCVKFSQKTGYYERMMYFSLNNYQKVNKVVIIDCINSTGGSIKAAIKEFKKLEIKVAGVCVAINKTNYSDKSLMKKIKNKFFAVYDVKILKNAVKVVRSKYFKESKTFL